MFFLGEPRKWSPYKKNNNNMFSKHLGSLVLRFPFLGSTGPKAICWKFLGRMPWVVPPPTNSHHQDCYIFSRGIPINLHLPQLLGGGTIQTMPVYFCVFFFFGGVGWGGWLFWALFCWCPWKSSAVDWVNLLLFSKCFLSWRRCAAEFCSCSIVIWLYCRVVDWWSGPQGPEKHHPRGIEQVLGQRSRACVWDGDPITFDSSYQTAIESVWHTSSHITV